jgi:hypothetical protein
MLEAQLITDRRLAYANCAADAGDELRRKRPTSSNAELAALRRRLWLLLWAKHVMCAYVLEGEECHGQWQPTDEDVRCAMKVADPGCVKCGCSDPPNPARTTPPSPPCNIVRNVKVRRAVDASQWTAGLSDTKVYVVSNLSGVTNAWSPYVGHIVKGPLHHIVPEGWVVYAVVSANYWVQTPDGPGAYFPGVLLNGIDATHIQVQSLWPNVNAYQGFTVKIEIETSGAWSTIYQGADPLGEAQTYAVADSTLVTSARITYVRGACSYGPYIYSNPAAHDTGDSHDESFG